MAFRDGTPAADVRPYSDREVAINAKADFRIDLEAAKLAPKFSHFEIESKDFDAKSTKDCLKSVWSGAEFAKLPAKLTTAKVSLPIKSISLTPGSGRFIGSLKS